MDIWISYAAFDISTFEVVTYWSRDYVTISLTRGYLNSPFYKTEICKFTETVFSVKSFQWKENQLHSDHD